MGKGNFLQFVQKLVKSGFLDNGRDSHLGIDISPLFIFPVKVFLLTGQVHLDSHLHPWWKYREQSTQKSEIKGYRTLTGLSFLWWEVTSLLEL